MLRTQVDINPFLTRQIFNQTHCRWEELLDLERNYTFEVETNFSVMQVEGGLVRHMDRHSVQSKHSTEYLASQYLADCSLSQELHLIDSAPGTTRAPPRSVSEPGPMIDPKNTKLFDDDGTAGTLQMDVDEINTHECMPSIITAIHRLASKYQLEWNETREAQAASGNGNWMPDWMKFLREKMARPQEGSQFPPYNLRIFVAKIVVCLPLSVCEMFFTAHSGHGIIGECGAYDTT